MRCKILILSLCALTLAGCGRSGSRAVGQLAAMRADINRDGTPQFSFTNFWSFEMRRDAIAPRFERTRTTCQSIKALQCTLVNSSINSSTGYPAGASLEVLLPHSQIEGFKKGILAPIAGEPAGEATIRSNVTRAENIGADSADASRKVLRLTAYHDRLVALSKRTNLTIEDTIRLEAEISKVQGDLDSALKDKTDTDSRIAKETVNISFSAFPDSAIASVFDRASDTFVESLASALEFLIGSIPWLPIVAAAVALITWLVRFLWRRKQRN